jgi:hypothetical protein
LRLHLKNILVNLSDLQLQMPWEIYKRIACDALTDATPLTIQDTDILLQLVSQAPAKHLHLTISQYIDLKEALHVVFEAFEKALNDGKEKIKNDNPYVADEVQLLDEETLNATSDEALANVQPAGDA